MQCILRGNRPSNREFACELLGKKAYWRFSEAMSLPNMTHAAKPVDTARCQTIVWNILHMLNSTQSSVVTSPALIRELFQTARCDNLFSTTKVQQLRNDISDYLGVAAMQQIDSYNEDDLCKRKCNQALIHYNSWATTVLRSELNSWNWFVYGFETHTERIFAAVGIITTGFVAVKGTAKILLNTRTKSAPSKTATASPK